MCTPPPPGRLQPRPSHPVHCNMHFSGLKLIFIPALICLGAVCLGTNLWTLFLPRDDAHALLRRSRRANAGRLEELKPGSMERECVEEVCDYEEAREIFEDDAKTPCLNNPCKNNGTCIYIANAYECHCVQGFEGAYCQEGTVGHDVLKCLYMNGGCGQFCDGSGPRRKCDCVPGYTLGPDAKQCIPQVPFPCGKVPLLKNEKGQVAQGHLCPKGHCPWQVLLKLKGQDLCGGALLHADWVITAAHCVHQQDAKDLSVIAGEHNLDMVEGTEQTVPVSQVVVHKRFNESTGDSDIALLRLREPVTFSDYAVPVCLPRRDFAQSQLEKVHYHTVSGWGQRTDGGNVPPSQVPKHLASPFLRKLPVPVLSGQDCAVKSGLNVTENMMCAGYFQGAKESCRGDDGSPLVTQYGDTTFLTGVVAWGKGCCEPGYYGIYTKVSNFLDWVHGVTQSALPAVTSTATPVQRKGT
uniref:Coagulation factor VII n=1 Tax=Denticeps clupeoides TaxID=299321 RepID=A0AAY4EVC2_9TELE